MKTVGVITEYNPFHNGHAYHLAEARRLTGADYCIAVMSGSFVQRGEPACLDKYTRTKMALRSGADLVLELPVPFACGSAEFFAEGAVSLLHQLGMVNALCFGSELGETEPFLKAAQLLLHETDSFSDSLKKLLRSGKSYPAAREETLLSLLDNHQIMLPENFLKTPNNILGIEYVKALLRMNSSIVPVTLKRTCSYHSDQLEDTFCSAAAIRSFLNSCPEGQSASGQLRSRMPEAVFQLFESVYGRSMPVFSDDFSDVLLYRLLAGRNGDFSEYADVSPDLSNRIKNNLTCPATFTERIDSLKSRQYTRTRISRALLHILLEIREDEVLALHKRGGVPYARVLGFRKDAAPLLHHIKAHTQIPLLTKTADAPTLLTPEAMALLNREFFASDLYRNIVYRKFRTFLPTEYAGSPILL